MTKIFNNRGIDIQTIIADNLGPDLLPTQLIKRTPGERTSTALASGTNPQESTFSCRGFIEEYKNSQIDGTQVRKGDRKVLILGGTLPTGIVPESNDRIVIEGETLVIVRDGVTRDPAEATYVCQSR